MIYPHNVEHIKSTIGDLQKSPLFVNHIPMAQTDQPYAEIGSRLEAMRTKMSDMNQREWAEKHGFNPTQYNNWAKGTRRITVDAAEVLCVRYGLTLDAIYRGRVSGLPENLSKIF